MNILSRNQAVQARAASGINVVLGIWLIVSPWVFDYSGRSAVLSSVFVGALIATLAAMRLTALHGSAGLSGINLLLGFWTIVSPWAIGHVANKGAAASDIIVGVFVTVLAMWSASATLS